MVTPVSIFLKEKENIIAEQQSDIEIKKKLFPGLALPNDPSVRTSMVIPVSIYLKEKENIIAE